MKRVFLSITVLAFSFLLAACDIAYFGGNDEDSFGSGGGGPSYGSPYPGGGGWGRPNGSGSGNQNSPKPGQLTGGEWSDIKNYDFYLNLFDVIEDPEIEESQRREGFSKFIGYFGFETRYMVTVNTARDELPIDDAAV